MNIEERFQQAFNRLEEKIEKRLYDGIYTALGYTSNLDLLCDFQAETLNRLLDTYMQGKNLLDMRPVELVQSVPQLLEAIVYYCINGIGGEVDIEDGEFVKKCFPCKNGMGGTAVQAALALAQISGPSMVHLTDDSPEVCEQLVSPYINIINDKGEMVSADHAVHTHEQEQHFILQFKKGDVIRLGEQEIEIPVSNRLILTKNTVNIELPFWEPYFKWIEDHADKVSSNVLSSFNCILDKEILKERLAYVISHVEKYHKNNPKGVVYFEDAHYHDAEIRRMCVEMLYPSVDILSMNEEELQYTLKEMYHFDIDIDEIYSCIEGVEYLIKKFDIPMGVVVHTKDYAMFVGDPRDVDIESGLMFGAIMATAKAAYGGYGNKQMLQEVLKFDLSDKGRYNLRKVEESKYADRVILVPTRYIDKPKYTIGLGDSFTGGVQMTF